MGLLLDMHKHTLTLYLNKKEVGEVQLIPGPEPFYPAFFVYTKDDALTVDPVAALPPGVEVDNGNRTGMTDVAWNTRDMRQ